MKLTIGLRAAVRARRSWAECGFAIHQMNLTYKLGRPYSTLLTELNPTGVLTVTLNRPDSLNAFLPAMRDDLVDVISSVRWFR